MIQNENTDSKLSNTVNYQIITQTSHTWRKIAVSDTKNHEFFVFNIPGIIHEITPKQLPQINRARNIYTENFCYSSSMIFTHCDFTLYNWEKDAA